MTSKSYGNKRALLQTFYLNCIEFAKEAGKFLFSIAVFKHGVIFVENIAYFILQTIQGERFQFSPKVPCMSISSVTVPFLNRFLGKQLGLPRTAFVEQ